MFQETTTEGCFKVPHSALSSHAFHVGGVPNTCGFERQKYNRSLWRLCDSVSPCALFYTSGCDVDGGGGSAHVPEVGHCFHSNNKTIHGLYLYSLLE